MTLGFSTKIKGKPTYFVEKIKNSLSAEVFERMVASNIQNGKYLHKSYKDVPNNFYPKIHTIREDKKDRWKVGSDIHFVINNRTKNRFQFAPVLKVKSIQKIEIIWLKPECRKEMYVFIDDRRLSLIEINKLAVNDGFNDVKEFSEWFSENFEGKIIHWTDYSY